MVLCKEKAGRSTPGFGRLIAISLQGVMMVVLMGVMNSHAQVTYNSANASYGPAMNYMLHCQGCHMGDGAGKDQFVPSFRNSVSRFLGTKEGRTYLVRVPGIAQSLLNDQERADVMNWIVKTFDPDHLPEDFTPFTAAELARWRYNALSDPLLVRARLISKLVTLDQPDLAKPAVAQVVQVGGDDRAEFDGARLEPPPSFALCAACHPLSSNGSNGMGPNLRGVVGRRAGSHAGFSYSSAMRSVDITWTPDHLDQFLKSPGQMIPGNLMGLPGIQDENERKAIVEYLKSISANSL